MTMFFHSLIFGYGVAALGALGLSELDFTLWIVIPAAWIGGNVLGLGLAAIGASLWPEKPARRTSSVASPDEFRLWDEDLTRELIDRRPAA